MPLADRHSGQGLSRSAERAGTIAGQEPVRHYYSSKPALLPTLIAGILYPARVATGVPLDRVVLQERAPRWTQKPDPDAAYGVKAVFETPKEPGRWPVYIFYFKPIVVLLNVIPFGFMLVLYSRVLDRHAANEWAWLFSLVAAAFGTYLLPFTQTLNNHTVAAFSAFFALYQLFWIWDRDDPSGWRFAAAGFFAAFCRGERAARSLVPRFVVCPVAHSIPRPHDSLFPAGCPGPDRCVRRGSIRCLWRIQAGVRGIRHR